MLLYFKICFLLAFIAPLLIGVFVLLKNSKAIINRTYFLTFISASFWSLGFWFLLNSKSYKEAYLWRYIMDFGSILLPAFWLHFVFSILGEKKKKIVITFYIFTSIVIILNALEFFLPGIFIKTLEQKLVFDFYPTASFGYYLFALLYIVIIPYSLWILINKYKESSRLNKVQLKFILVASIFGFSGGGMAFLPTFNIYVLPLGVIFIPIYPIIIGYAIIKYRFLNIRLVVTRSILYTILVATVASFFALAVVVVGNAIGDNTQTSKIFTYIITSFIVVVFLDPVKRAWAKITDKIFYKDKIDYQELLREAGNVVAREIDLRKLLEGTTKLLADKLKIKQVSSFVLDSKGNFYLLTNSDKKEIASLLSDNFLDYLKKNRKILIIDELIRDLGNLNEKSTDYKILGNFVKEAEARKAEMVVPIVENDKMTAILFFNAKQSGDLYNEENLDFLEVLTPQIATAIEKSKLYEEVEQFNKELQQKVDDRTKSLSEVNVALEERNKFLSTIQVVTNMISRTLDLKKVNQMIADSIATELGYVGGMLTFVDKTNKYLQVGAISNNEQTRKAFNILSKEPREYRTKLEESYNLSAQTFLTGKINFSDKLADFMAPPVDKVEVDEIQKKLGIKTIVGVPVTSEAKVIGVIQYYLPIKKDKISALDIEIMSALTNQVGIVSRNLKLYNTLQGANAELQDANTRLRELDKAKSEFLSIASHQLRTPISAIKGYLSMMIDGDFGPLPKNINDVIKNIFESSARLARLINIFLNVSRIESGRLKLDKKPIQINDMIDSVIIELINQAKQKGVKLEYKKKKKAPPLILADADKLREVVLNLVDNSIKYTPKGSIIVTVDANGRELNFKVTDTGIGIKKDEVKTLFRKFVRGSGVAQIHTGGSGLGLFIAQKIIKEHNGQVWAESEGSGKGSVFQFTVPVYDDNQPPTYKKDAEEK
jgi:signal transduction histidine kinase